jgi:hypothetical protein
MGVVSEHGLALERADRAMHADLRRLALTEVEVGGSGSDEGLEEFVDLVVHRKLGVGEEG